MIIHEVSVSEFYSALKLAKQKNSYGCFVTLNEEKEYNENKNFLIDNGVGGFSITKDGDLISVFKNPELAGNNQEYKNLIDIIMIVAIKKGAIKTDCYSDFLADVYMKYGFIPVGKVKFDIQYNKEWDTLKHGKPDVIALCKVNIPIDELIKYRNENLFVNYWQLKDKIEYFENYDCLLGFRDKVLNHIANNNMTYNQSINYVTNLNKRKDRVYEQC